MALIPCPHCGKEISSYAKRCPSCGMELVLQSNDSICCPECGNQYSKDMKACPTCGEPNKKISQEKAETTSEDINTVDSAQKIVINCCSCGAPISVESQEQYEYEVICPYCGGLNIIENEEEDNSEEISLDIKRDTINGSIPAKLSDKDCEKYIVTVLVKTDYVPTDILDSFSIRELLHKQYPLYALIVNWTSQWSARFSKEVSHEEPTYDYNGKVTGKQTVKETLYRDASGTSAGDTLLVLPATDRTVNNEETILEYIRDHYDSIHHKMQPDFDNKKSQKGWDLIYPNLDKSDALDMKSEFAKKIIENDVDNKTSSDAKSVAGREWNVDGVHYTYSYHIRHCECFLFPIIEVKYLYKNKEFGASIDACEGHVFLDTLRPQNDKEFKEKTKCDNESKTYRKKQVAWYWVFGIFAGASVIFFILQLCLGQYEYDWDIPITLITAVVSFFSLLAARKWQSRNYNVQNTVSQMLFVSKEKRKASAKKKYNLDIDIGGAPEKKNISQGLLVAFVGFLILMLCVTVGNLIKFRHDVHEEQIHFAKLQQAEDRAKERAVGTYYFTKSHDVYEVEVKNDGTVVVSTVDSYDSNDGHHRNSERKSQSGTWSVSDPSKNVDISISLDGYGLSLYGLQIIDGVAYTGSSSEKIGMVISEAQLNSKKSEIKNYYTKTWENNYTIDYYYYSTTFTNKLRLKSDGTVELSGVKHKSYDEDVTVTCLGRWEVVLISPDYGEVSDLQDSKYWGVLISIDKDDDFPDWVYEMSKVYDYSNYSSSKRQYLISSEDDVLSLLSHRN